MDVIKGRNYLVVRQVGGTLRNSVFNQLQKTIIAMGLKHLFSVSGGNLAITYIPNGRQILFSGLDDAEKLKSITPSVGVLTDVFIEEATEIAYESYKQLTKRLRGLTGDEEMDKQAKRITFAFNPILKTHWIYREFFGDWDDTKSRYETEDLLIVKTTYRDNHFLTKDDVAALEAEKDPYYRAVYLDGQWGVLGKVIFRNWHTEDLSKLIPTFDRIYNGCDFGFQVDPTAIIRCHIDQKRKKIYVFQEFYKVGMTNDEIIEKLKEMIGNEYITCDSAEPRTIDALCRAGIRALPVSKGKDSIMYGIDWLLGYEIIVDVSCKNFKQEIQAYCWQEDKYGNALRKPVDKENHGIDAFRYGCSQLFDRGEMRAGKRL